MNKTILRYFSEGFSLANRSLDIFAISVFFLVFAQIRPFPHNSPMGKGLGYIDFILQFFQFGFSMSIPVFFLWKQQGIPLRFQRLWSTLAQNTKRMILPTLLYILFGIAFLFATVIIARLSNGQQFVAVLVDIVNFSRNWFPFIIKETVMSLFIFTPVYFSLEHDGFFTAAKKSILLSIKNLRYVALVMLIFAVTHIIVTYGIALLPISFLQAKYVLIGIMGEYINLVIIASTLYFYQHRVRAISQK